MVRWFLVDVIQEVSLAVCRGSPLVYGPIESHHPSVLIMIPSSKSLTVFNPGLPLFAVHSLCEAAVRSVFVAVLREPFLEHLRNDPKIRSIVRFLV